MKKFYLELQPELMIQEDGEYIFLIDGRNKNLIEQDIVIQMAKGEISSRVIFKIITTKDSEIVINPLLKIEKGQKKTDTYISIKVLNIDSPKKIKVIPSLEIKENDVKAGHGAVVSGINKDEIYYLQSKGLSYNDSRQLLIESFITKN